MTHKTKSTGLLINVSSLNRLNVFRCSNSIRSCANTTLIVPSSSWKVLDADQSAVTHEHRHHQRVPDTVNSGKSAN